MLITLLNSFQVNPAAYYVEQVIYWHHIVIAYHAVRIENNHN